nr:small multidrug export protein [Oscillospiraceae bacterium]
MIEAIGELLASIPKELYVFIISVLPVVELRGSIPVGAALGLPFYLNYGLAVIGNLLPVPFILAFIPMILNFLSRFRVFRPIVEWLRKKADKNKDKIDKNSRKINTSENENCVKQIGEPINEQIGEPIKKRKLSVGIFVALMLFVAIPLPGTGAWTGSLVTSLFDMPKRSSFLAIMLGVMISGVIMCLASYGVIGFLSFLL